MISDEDIIVIKTRSESTKLTLGEILLVQRKLRKLYIVSESRQYEYYEKMENVEPLLDEPFFQVLDGTYVNIEKIKTIHKGSILFDNGYEFFLRERVASKVRQKHTAYHKTKQLDAVDRALKKKQK